MIGNLRWHELDPAETRLCLGAEPGILMAWPGQASPPLGALRQVLHEASKPCHCSVHAQTHAAKRCWRRQSAPPVMPAASLPRMRGVDQASTKLYRTWNTKGCLTCWRQRRSAARMRLWGCPCPRCKRSGPHHRCRHRPPLPPAAAAADPGRGRALLPPAPAQQPSMSI